MAAIDSLLRLVSSQSAEALFLATGQVPVMRKGGADRPLSMPALDVRTMQRFLDEVLAAEQREVLARTQRIEASYRSGDAQYGVLARWTGPTSLELALHVGALPRDVPTAAPVAAEKPMSVAHTALAPLLAQAIGRDASDLFLSEGEPPRLRVSGKLRVLDAAPVEDVTALLALDEPHRAALSERGSVDLALVVDLAGQARRVRANVFRQARGLAAALRPIREGAPTLAELELPESLHELVDHPNGLVLVAGQTGAGKSTTLAALIEHVNRTRPAHVVTLEDPIEYVYRRGQSLVHQREIGAHVESFATGLRAALRESPDVILLGELRDRETMSAALTAAETGHLVLATVHARSGPAALERIIDVFPEGQQGQIRVQLASVLRATLAQRLVPRSGGGRIPAIERMNVTPSVAAVIRDGRLHQLESAIQAGRADGMIPFELSLAKLLKAAKIDPDTASKAAADPRYLRELSQKA